MSTRQQKFDPAQGVLDFSATVEAYVKDKEKLVSSMIIMPSDAPETEQEISMMLGVSIKSAQEESGLSREQICDGVNQLLQRSEEKFQAKECHRPLSVDMLNNHISRPYKYPIDACALYAITVVCSSLAPAKIIAASIKGQVVTQEEARLAAIGKIDEASATLQRYKKQLKGMF